MKKRTRAQLAVGMKISNAMKPEMLIALWWQASSRQDLIKKLKPLGIRIKAAEDRARYYRARGVPMKYFCRAPGGYNYQKLRKLAHRLAKGAE